jgi:two-component system cell cycle sensor histidine kinase PleC
VPKRHPSPRSRRTLLDGYSQTFGEMMLRRQSELAIHAARQEAELNARSKSAFLSTMSHELRTPLNAIIGFSDLLGSGGGAGAEYAQHIGKAGRRLLDVVTDVLDMSKLESGSFEINKASCLVSDVIDMAVARTQDAFSAKHQTLDIRAAGLGEAELDAKRIAQLLANLLSNASKFTPEQGRVLLMAQLAQDGALTIAIADTGIGMTHEQMMVAVRPFSQVDDQRARLQEGAGLGLPLAVGIARLHGGNLHIDSQPGQGTTVVFTLPKPASRAAALATGRAA